jgi:hypothetical protein
LPKAGKYEYPFFDIDSVLEKLKKVHEVNRQDEIERSLVAETLGMSITGGGFAYLIASMEKYGLIKTGSGKIIISDLGKLALYGNDQEKEQAKHQAVLNVELFSELLSQYGKNATEEQIKAFLRQKAFVDIVKAQKLAPSVDKIYKNVANYLRPADAEPQPSESAAESKGRRESMNIPTSKNLEIKYKGVLIQLPPDLEALEFAEKAIAFMKKEIQSNPDAQTNES